MWLQFICQVIFSPTLRQHLCNDAIKTYHHFPSNDIQAILLELEAGILCISISNDINRPIGIWLKSNSTSYSQKQFQNKLGITVLTKYSPLINCLFLQCPALYFVPSIISALSYFPTLLALYQLTWTSSCSWRKDSTKPLNDLDINIDGLWSKPADGTRSGFTADGD